MVHKGLTPSSGSVRAKQYTSWETAGSGADNTMADRARLYPDVIFAMLIVTSSMMRQPQFLRCERCFAE